MSKYFRIFSVLFALSFITVMADIAKEYSDCANEILREFSEEFHYDGLRYIGKTSRLQWETQKITVRAHVQKNGTIEEARLLEVMLSDKILDKFNSNQKIRPYLRKYPYTRDMIRLEIYFEDANRSYNKTGEVIYTVLANGSIFYKKYVKSGDLFYNILTETFDEALKKIESRNSATVM